MISTRSPRPTVALILLAVGLAGSAMLGLLLGAVASTPADLIHMIGQRLGVISDPENLTDSVLWAIRLPRVLSGALAGAGLATAGAALQGTFRNPMADPHLIGIVPAAGLGAIGGIAVTPAGGSPTFMVMGAAVAGVACALLMRRIGTRVGDSSQFILIGIALGLGILAWLGAIVLAWDSPRVPTFMFWVFGGLSGATWSTLVVAAPAMAVGMALVLSQSRAIDILSLGETEAGHLGVPVERVMILVLAGVGIAVGAAVGLSGVVGFVGLVVPLLIRRILGPHHRLLLPASALGGAIMVVAVDVLARTVASPVEIPVGLLTAVIGAPVFLWFLARVGRIW